ncbi:MAG: RNA 2',3'-cyclic phosphodiesterase [Candidatus Omnitrophica bacterium]|nr:RNA 2',3'-cyclic phosphodiesterase [Candidatus Omnitrophota bacterium]
MRTFIAIELPEEIKGALSRLQEKLKAAGADVKWVEPENIHLTLKFLGERDDKRVEKIKELLDEACAGRKPFLMRLDKVGAFPSLNSPRVIWVSVREGDTEAKEIAADLEEKICRLGIPKEERPFQSHITIARLRSPQNRQPLVQELKKLEDKPLPENLGFTVKKITLFKSTLTPKGPVYESLKEANLKIS